MRFSASLPPSDCSVRKGNTHWEAKEKGTPGDPGPQPILGTRPSQRDIIRIIANELEGEGHTLPGFPGSGEWQQQLGSAFVISRFLMGVVTTGDTALLSPWEPQATVGMCPRALCLGNMHSTSLFSIKCRLKALCSFIINRVGHLIVGSLPMWVPTMAAGGCLWWTCLPPSPQ